MSTRKQDVARPRDRDATAAAIVEAAKASLAEEGFVAFGVNAVARRAGCDKQLVYRYFGGLDGLLAAVGEELAHTLAADLSIAASAQPQSYGELIAAAAAALVDVYRRHPVLRQIHAWESAAPTPAVRKLAEARARQLMAWVEALRGPLRPPPDLDFAAVNATLFAAVQQLAIAGCANGSFAGMALQTEHDWERVRRAVAQMARAAYA
jgi:AcrR family transcriptional regulator